MNKKLKIFCLMALVFVSAKCFADSELFVSLPSTQINHSTELGVSTVEGIGDVKLVAHKNGNQLIVHAQDSEGRTIGKAETIAGLKETPLYVTTPQGLQKIIIYWGKEKLSR